MISKKAKYALKALEYIAKHEKEGPLTISTVSKGQDIPKKFLEAILLELKRDGILQSWQGKQGGYALQRKPKDINIGHVIRLIDGPLAFVPCVSYKFYRTCEECFDEETCGLKSVMSIVRENTNKVFEKMTLAEVLKRESMLLQVKKPARKAASQKK
jgi:Rrf2 family protein